MSGTLGRASGPCQGVIWLIGERKQRERPPAAVAEAVAALTKAMLAADKAQLDTLVADQLSYGHSGGVIQTKAEFVDVIASKKAVYKSIVLSDQTVAVAGNAAIVRHAWASVALRAELQASEASEKAVFKAPPGEWIANRLMALQPVLEAEPSKSVLVLPVEPQIGKLYYQTETAPRVLASSRTRVKQKDPQRSHAAGPDWWRRWELNPRPETLRDRHLHP